MRHFLALMASVLAVIGAAVTFDSVGSAQEITPRSTPTVPTCARPNVPARVLRTVEPEIPAMATQQGIYGTVLVVVSLDADSRLVGARIQSSPSALLNQSAISAARQTIFQAQIRGCQPIAADYIFSVEFIRSATFSVTGSGERIVSVTGDGSALRAPDSAVLQTTIVTHDPVAANASAKNDAIFESLKAKLGALESKNGEIASLVSVQPYRPAAEIVGFTAARQVTITADSVANAAHLAFAVASEAGIEHVVIRYLLNDHVAASRDALAEALNDAERAAREAVARKGLHLGVRRDVVVPPDDTAPVPYTRVPYVLVPVVGGFKEPEIRIPYVAVHATATVTYTIKP